MRNVFYALRIFRHNWPVTIVIILSLGLGIGANTTVFTLINSILLKPLPVKDPETLILFENISDRGVQRPFSIPMLEELHRQAPDIFLEIFGWSSSLVNIHRDGEIEQVSGLLAEPNFFSSLGIQPLIGRNIEPGDTVDVPVAMIGYPFWQSHFGGDRAVLGKTIRIDETPVTIIGVTPPEFFGVRVGGFQDVFLPLSAGSLMATTILPYDSRALLWVGIMGRLKPGVTLDQAQASLKVLSPQVFESTLPLDAEGIRREGFLAQQIGIRSASTGLSGLREQYSSALYILMALVGMILLIACLNLANLMLARARMREVEMGVRLSLGATRRHLFSQLITESILVSGMGALLALFFARWGSQLIVGFFSGGRSHVYLDLSPDMRVFGFAVLAAVLTAVLVGVLPASRIVRIDPCKILAHGRGIVDRRFTSALSRSTVAVQVALSVVLLIAAGLLARSFQNLTNEDLGLEPDHVLLVLMSPRRTATDLTNEYYLQLLERVQSLPGVQSASVVHPSPMIALDMSVPISGYAPGEDTTVYRHFAAPGLFKTFGIQFLQGRDFDFGDSPQSPKVAIINQTMAGRLFGSEDPMGVRVRVGTREREHQVIGVVADSKYDDIRVDPPPTIYLASLQYPGRSSTLAIRTEGDPNLVAGAVRHEINELGVEIPIRTSTFNERMNWLLSQDRLLATLSCVLALLALLVTGIGVYGIVSYAVTTRTREIGIRMALGARMTGIQWLIIRELLPFLLVGLAIGVIFAVWASHLLSSILFGLAPYDPTSFISSSILIMIVGLLSALIPATRASRLSPADALRYE